MSDVIKDAMMRTDWDVNDPFKAITRELDTRIVDRGGSSIFGREYRRQLVTGSSGKARDAVRDTRIGIPEKRLSIRENR